jgi:hypothetical protein
VCAIVMYLFTLVRVCGTHPCFKSTTIPLHAGGTTDEGCADDEIGVGQEDPGRGEDRGGGRQGEDGGSAGGQHASGDDEEGLQAGTSEGGGEEHRVPSIQAFQSGQVPGFTPEKMQTWRGLESSVRRFSNTAAAGADVGVYGSCSRGGIAQMMYASGVASQCKGLFDLGSGLGRILIAARVFAVDGTGTLCVGVESSSDLIVLWEGITNAGGPVHPFTQGVGMYQKMFAELDQGELAVVDRCSHWVAVWHGWTTEAKAGAAVHWARTAAARRIVVVDKGVSVKYMLELGFGEVRAVCCPFAVNLEVSRQQFTVHVFEKV